eukprot:scaffold68892_cov52-Phaeocystis_antarctica.AAC.4
MAGGVQRLIQAAAHQRPLRLAARGRVGDDAGRRRANSNPNPHPHPHPHPNSDPNPNPNPNSDPNPNQVDELYHYPCTSLPRLARHRLRT